MTTWQDGTEALKSLEKRKAAHWENYLGFYSSWLGGYFREPWAMLIPMDDHGFHRGDAVFEAARLHDGAYFDLDSHLLRLQRSATSIGMELPKSLDEIREICVTLAKLCGARDGALRLYVTRGPGGFSPSPREVVGHQVYAAITKMKPPTEQQYSAGVRAMYSTVPAKDAFWSQIKSCNYLQNVLMKKETLERGFDFAISIDAEGRLAEGSTENMMLISQAGEMLVPKFDYTLRGTTLIQVMKIAEKLVKDGTLKSVRFADLHKDDLAKAKEAAFVGTTLGVLPIGSVESQTLGPAGPVCRKLQELLMTEMKSSPELRTPYL